MCHIHKQEATNARMTDDGELKFYINFFYILDTTASAYILGRLGALE